MSERTWAEREGRNGQTEERMDGWMDEGTECDDVTTGRTVSEKGICLSDGWWKSYRLLRCCGGCDGWMAWIDRWTDGETDVLRDATPCHTASLHS